MLPGVSPVDPLILLGTVVILGGCALLTALPPALRTANVNPSDIFAGNERLGLSGLRAKP